MVDLNRFHLNGLRAIEVVARRGTLSRAAEELGTTAGAVSQLVIKAERQLGRPVFLRSRTGLVLTPFGRALAVHLEAGFVALAQGVAGALAENSQCLRVSTTLSFAEKWLVRRLPDFRAAHPDIRVQVDSGLGLRDLSQGEADVALRFGTGAWPGTRAERLSAYRVFPVCAPEVARTLTVPGELCAANIIRYENAHEVWDDWARSAGMTEPLPEGMTFSEAALCINAAISGLGVALAWDILVEDELRDGRLVRPFPQEVRAEFNLWFVTAKNRGTDPKTAAFKAWIKRQLRT
jgi:DNA-binding transcriptional LysR family regulator